MARIIDKTGRTYGDLTVLAPDGFVVYGDSPRKYYKWRCLCACGNEVSVLQSNLYRQQRCDACRRGARTHGMSSSRAFLIWCKMRDRCNNPRSTSYANYGGRGISICEEWSDFSAFLRDMGPPADGETIERIDNSSGYSKRNCRWIPREQQSGNRRCCVRVSVAGVDMCLARACRLLDVNYNVIKSRINRNGMSVEDALLSSPVVAGWPSSWR